MCIRDNGSKPKKRKDYNISLLKIRHLHCAQSAVERSLWSILVYSRYSNFTAGDTAGGLKGLTYLKLQDKPTREVAGLLARGRSFWCSCPSLLTEVQAHESATEK